MNIKHIFSLAALAVMTAACSSEDITQQQPASQIYQKLPFRATISTSAGTRGLTETTDGKTITAAWVVGEKIALVHGKTVDVMTVKSVDTEGDTKGYAYIEGTITNFVDNETVHLVYTGSSDGMALFGEKLEMVLGDYPGYTEITAAHVMQTLETMLLAATQDGTLTSISNELDYRLGQSTLTKTNGTVTLASSTTLASQFAIWKLSLTTDGTTALAATKLELDITEGSDNTVVSVTPAAAASTFYVVLPPATSATYKFTATTSDGGNYYCTYNGVKLDAANFYRSTLTFTLQTTGGSVEDYGVETETNW